MTVFKLPDLGEGLSEAEVLRWHVQVGDRIEPGLAERLFSALREGARTVEEQGHPAVLVVSPAIRPWLSKAVRFRVTDLTILSYSEIPEDQMVKVIHTVHAESKK